MSKASAEIRDVIGYEGLYQVTSDGRILSTPRKGSKGGDRKLYTDKHGYKRVGLTKEGKGATLLVHAIVAAAFIGKRPKGYDVCHKDGSRVNDHSNLYYGTRSENAKDMVRHGTSNLTSPNHIRAKGEGCPWSKVTEDMVRYIRKMKGTKTCRELGEELGVTYGNISAIWTFRSWREVV